jgi:hypothetical protein
MLDILTRKSKRSLRINKGLIIVAFIYFFINSFLLPPGLLYTIIITPILILWIRKEHGNIYKIIFTYLFYLLFYFCIHIYNGIVLSNYIQSTILYLTCIIFATSIYIFINKYYYTYENILEKLLSFNFILIIVAILSLFTVKDNNVFWYKNENEILRLKMLTTESAAYSMLLVPIFFFYFQYYFYSNLNFKRRLYFLSVIFSLLLSLSFGTIGSILFSISLLLCFNLIYSTRLRYSLKFFTLFILIIALGTILLIGPLRNSLITERLINIFDGNDTSVNGRSFEAYFLANKIAELKSAWFGVGPGQVKILGKKIIEDFYSYNLSENYNQETSARIPSAIGDTLATFGYFGILIRFFVIIYLFFKTKVIKSSYRFCLFLYIFLIQFVGSNLGNISEYFIWVLAFSNVFPDEYFKKDK